jgi:hypothetical protein
LNDLCVPSGGRTYNALIRGLVSSEEIRNFAANIKDILKGKNDVFDERSCEIAGIFLTSEYFRGKAAPIIGYAEFYKLKHDPTNERLSSVFKDKLLFAQAGGSVAIMNVKPNILQQSFLEMLEVPQEGIYALYRKMPASR